MTFEEWRIKEIEKYKSRLKDGEPINIGLLKLEQYKEKNFDFSGIILDDLAGIEKFVSLEYLRLENSKIEKLPYLPNLKTLSIIKNQSDCIIEKFSEKLEKLYLWKSNKITKLPILPKSLKALDINECTDLKSIEFVPIELLDIVKHPKTDIWKSGLFPIERMYTYSWEEYVTSFHLKPGDEDRGLASIYDTGLFDFKN